MSVPGNLALMPPIPREIDPQIQAYLLAQRLGIPTAPPPALTPPVAAAVPPTPALPSNTLPPAPAVAAVAPSPPPGNVPYRTGMAPQAPLGAVINPAAGSPINPFSQADQGPPEPERAPPTNEGQPVVAGQAAAGEPQKQKRFQAWRDFIQRFKTDPDTRMSVMQSILALTQPAGNAPEAIGNALNVGQKTLHALQTQRFEQGRQTAEDQRSERETNVREGALELDRQQAATRKDQGQQELDLRLKGLEQDAAYQKELLDIRRLEATNSGGGQVNNRIENLAQLMVKQPDADLLRFPEGDQRLNRARLRAFDAVQSAGQTRQKFIAEEVARQQLFLPEPNDPTYQTELANLVQRVGSFADAAGLFDERVAPVGSAGPSVPGSAGGQLPPGVTEEDIQATMKIHGLTREQVLARIGAAR